MGIEATLKSVSGELLDRLRGQADLAQIFALLQPYHLTIKPLFPNGVPDALQAQWAQLSGDSMGPYLLRALREEQPERYRAISHVLPLIESAWLHPALDLYKGWDVLQYILSAGAGPQGPLANAINGGRELAPGLDDPPITYLDEQEVQAVSAALDACDFERAERETREHDASGVYHWGRAPRDHSGLHPFFRALVDYYREAASAGRAMLRWKS